MSMQDPHTPSPVLDLDRAAHAALGRLTQGLSPASFLLAYLDWAVHLAIAPGKQQALARKAVQQWLRLAEVAMPSTGPVKPCIEPLPQDHRFDDPAWHQWPFNVMAQGFLLTQQWWHGATTDVRGVTPHHQDVVTFNARQALDMLAPSNFLASNPEAWDATCKEQGLNLWRGAFNAAEDWAKALKRDHGTSEPADFVVGRHVAVTPGQVVFRNDLIELIQYAPTTAKVLPEPILIVPSWIMKYYILDLSPHNSLVRYLVGQGHTVFILSWRNPTAADRALGMDDYLQLSPVAALKTVQQLMPGRPVHGVGYCLGGTLLAIAAAAWARDGQEGLATLSLLATQTDFEEPGELSLFIDDSQLTYLDDLMWEQGVLEGPQMGGSFTYLNTRDLLWSRLVRDYLLGTRQPLNDLMAWNQDVTRMPHRMHSEYLRSLYLHNDLAHGSYEVGDRPVALSDIRVPIFSVGTVKDHISPWRSVYKLHLLTGTPLTFALVSGGHNAGIVSEPGHAGRSYQLHTRPEGGKYIDPDTWLNTAEHHEGSWWSAWQAWLAAHSGKLGKPPAMGHAAKGLPPLGDAPGQYVLAR
ncbi:MAG: poly-beta-hydroxybutyrate polymerase [Leptothrix sp. (in: Bacteria)]|nr:poly-beta-hydroxybutyrate polymerase [Leptothrix sp. (in: b-proteobacteria)]